MQSNGAHLRQQRTPTEMLEICNNDDLILAAMQRGIYDAFRIHKAFGVPIAVADEDGTIREIPADQIEIPDAEPLAPASG